MVDVAMRGKDNWIISSLVVDVSCGSCHFGRPSICGNLRRKHPGQLESSLRCLAQRSCRPWKRIRYELLPSWLRDTNRVAIGEGRLLRRDGSIWITLSCYAKGGKDEEFPLAVPVGYLGAGASAACHSHCRRSNENQGRV